MHPIQTFVRRYEWVHTSLGLAGNTSFLVGSILFLWESTKHVGTWLFIVGAALMLVGSIGSAIVKLDRSGDHDGDPGDGDGHVGGGGHRTNERRAGAPANA